MNGKTQKVWKKKTKLWAQHTKKQKYHDLKTIWIFSYRHEFIFMNWFTIDCLAEYFRKGKTHKSLKCDCLKNDNRKMVSKYCLQCWMCQWTHGSITYSQLLYSRQLGTVKILVTALTSKLFSSLIVAPFYRQMIQQTVQFTLRYKSKT